MPCASKWIWRRDNPCAKLDWYKRSVNENILLQQKVYNRQRTIGKCQVATKNQKYIEKSDSASADSEVVVRLLIDCNFFYTRKV